MASPNSFMRRPTAGNGIYGRPMFNMASAKRDADAFLNRPSYDLSKYEGFNNPRQNGVMNVADATAAGGQVMQWLPSTGVGPGTRGYRGSWEGGYGHGGGRSDFRTGRPTAKTADEYYSKRDAAIGNPIEMLKRFGPNRGNLMSSLIAEARGGGAAPPAGGTVMVNGEQVPMTEEDISAASGGPSGETPFALRPRNIGAGLRNTATVVPNALGNKSLYSQYGKGFGGSSIAGPIQSLITRPKPPPIPSTEGMGFEAVKKPAPDSDLVRDFKNWFFKPKTSLIANRR